MQLKSLPAKILNSVHRKRVVDKNRIKKLLAVGHWLLANLEKRAKMKEQRTKMKEQRAKMKEQRAKIKEDEER